MTRDTFDFMHDNDRDRSRFGDNESLRSNADARSDIIDITLYLHFETPAKGAHNLGAIRVSKDGDDSHADWIPKSRCQFEKLDSYIRGRDSKRLPVTLQAVTVTVSEALAKEKGLI